MKINEKLLLKPEDFKPFFRGWKIDGIFNPAAIRLPNKKIILYVRVAEGYQGKKDRYPVLIPGKNYYCRLKKIPGKDIVSIIGNMIKLKNNTYRLSNISHFRKVVLDKSGFNVEKIIQKPIFYPQEKYENCGVEDPRIVKIGKNYLMSYATFSSEDNISTSLAVSKDLINWNRKKIIFSEQNKDVILFPEKINGKYIALHRPEGSFQFTNPSIWISYSKDLEYWGDEKSIIHPRKKSWDEKRIGAGCPPIKTKKGWLLIYHGVSKDNVYSAGAVLLNLKNPKKIIARSPKDKPLFSPRLNYEKKGFFSNVIFPTGIVLDLNKKDILIYSGAADRFISVKKISLKDILKSLKKF